MIARVQPVTFFSEIFRTLHRRRTDTQESLQARTDRLLFRLIRHSLSSVPFQQRRLKGINLNAFRFEDIPPTDKSELMEHFNDTIADGVVELSDVIEKDVEPDLPILPVVNGKYLASKTSGSSGEPSWIVQSLRDWSIQRGAVFAQIAAPWLTYRRLLMAAVNPLRCATVAAEHSLSMTWQFVRSAQLSGPFARSHFYSVFSPESEVIDGLNRVRPEYIHGYPTALESLGRAILAGAKIDFEPKLISVGSEKLNAISQSVITQAFPSATLIDHYGLTECLPLSTTCTHGRRHQNSDYAILEPVDENGCRVPDGTFSDHILVTNLINRTQPLIRYRVNDSVRFVPERCECGSPLPVIEMFSRKGDLIYLRSDSGDWKLLSSPIVVDTVLKTDGVAQFQVRHESQNRLEFLVVPDGGYEPATVASSLQHRFQETLAHLDCDKSVEIRVQAVEQLHRTSLGAKLQQMVSKVAPPSELIRQTQSVTTG